jgi:2-polyprenyl-3-methyl-5-hydroxy-6-metoxy-1,4-benzoquinol methylase
VSSLDDLLVRIAKKNPLQRVFLSSLHESGAFTEDDRKGLGHYVDYALEAGETLDDLAASYDQIVRDTLREQIFFRKHDRYRHERFEDVASSVYFDPAYMSRYMHGLALTAFLWPNHAAIRHHFESVLASVPSEKRKRYLEVGPGHGFYLTAAARAGFEHVEGIDLSPTSVALTKRIVESGRFGAADACVIREGDFLATSFDEPFDMLVMGEVLEHVEEPQRFLARLRELAREDATVYVTTCASSPAIDHIYLFRSVEEVTQMATNVGFRVRDVLALPHHGTTLEESTRARLPINLAVVLAP